MPKPLHRYWVIALLPAQLACQGVIDGSSAPGTPADPGAVPPADRPAADGGLEVPEQPIDALACEKRHAPVGRVYRLTPEQPGLTIESGFAQSVDISKFPKDGINQKTGFNNDAASSYVSVALADAVFDTAKAVAQAQTEVAVTMHACLAQNADDACLDTFIADYGARAFRRPLDAAETQRYRAFYRQQEQVHGAEVARRMVLEAMLNAASFVYRTEIGSGEKGEVALTPYEVASELSYTLTDAPPSAALMAAAASGEILTPNKVRELAQALLEDPRAKRKLGDFFGQYLQLGNLELGGVEAPLAHAMQNEAATFAEQVVWGPAGTLTEVFTASYTFVNEDLAELYGAPAPSSPFARVELNPAERSGIFTQLGFLASRHGPIHRGRVIKEGLLCGIIPAPPPGASAQLDKLEGPDPDATEQQKWVTFQADPSCGGCHAIFQPMGIAFDRYDDLGRYRSVNHAGRSIDASGSFIGAGELDGGTFADAKQLITSIVGSTTGRFCFAKRYMSFAHGREVNTGADACALKSVGDQFVASQLSIRELMLAVTADESFFRRTNVE